MSAEIPAVTGIGAALPDRVIGTSDIQALYPDDIRAQRMVGIVSKMVGIDTRRWVTPGEQATSDLGAEALRKAVEMARINLSDITSIAFATSSPDYHAVPASAMLQNELGLSDKIRCRDVGGNACMGLLHAIRDVIVDISNNTYGTKGPQAAVGVEILSNLVQTAEPDIATIFGDGGTALIIDMVTPDPGAPTKIGFAFGADGSLAESLYIPAGGSKKATSAQTIADNMHVVRMDGPKIKQEAVRRMVEMSLAAMDEAGITSKDAILIPHQANAAIMREVAKQLEFPDNQVISTIDHTGNTSAASTGIALAEAVGMGRVKRNDRVLMVAFGAGLNYGAIVLPMVGLPRE